MLPPDCTRPPAAVPALADDTLPHRLPVLAHNTSPFLSPSMMPPFSVPYRPLINTACAHLIPQLFANSHAQYPNNFRVFVLMPPLCSPRAQY